MTLEQKLKAAEKSAERDPIYVAVELNELQLLKRLLEDYLRDVDSIGGSSGFSMND